MERTRYSRRVKSPSYLLIEQQEEIAKSRPKGNSPGRGRSPGRSPGRQKSATARPRSRSRTPSRSRKGAYNKSNSSAANTSKVNSSVIETPIKSSYISPRSATPAANGAQKWKPNFERFKPSIDIDKEVVIDTFIEVFKVNLAVALVSAVTIVTIFSYLLCNKNHCKLPSKVPGLAKIIQDITPIAAYIYLGFFALQFLFAYIPKKSNIISTLVSAFAVGGFCYYPVYPITSLLGRPVEFLSLSFLTSLALAAILFVKGYKRSRSSLANKLIYGYLYGFRTNGEFFGKKLEVIFHQIGYIQLAILDILFAITLYESKFPILYSTVLVLHSLFVSEKILFANKKDYIPLDFGFFANFFYLVSPSVSSLAVYIAYKNSLAEHTFYEYAGGAAAVWLFGFYVYCKAKYDPPRRIPARKGFKARLNYIWNVLITSPWMGQALIELSIAGAVLPYSYLALISSAALILVTKLVPILD